MKASAIRYLIDAGPLVGALSARDQWHTWSTAVISTLEEPVFNLSSVWETRSHRAAELLLQYTHMDAGDASLVMLSEQFPRAKIITTDVRDFSVYRRFRDEPLPLVHP